MLKRAILKYKTLQLSAISTFITILQDSCQKVKTTQSLSRVCIKSQNRAMRSAAFHGQCDLVPYLHRCRCLSYGNVVSATTLQGLLSIVLVVD